MTNTSATGGYLAPDTTPLTQAALENLLHDALAGITGLEGDLVRPRYQPRPPKQPDADVDWCAFGVQSRPGLGFPAVFHKDTEDNGSDTTISWERPLVPVTFYGPNAQDLAKRLRTGLAVEQNRAELRSGGLALADVGQAVVVPELINNAWVQRVDLDLAFELEERRTYPVRNILCGPFLAESDTGHIVQTVPMTGEEGF